MIMETCYPFVVWTTTANDPTEKKEPIARFSDLWRAKEFVHSASDNYLITDNEGNTI